MSTPNSLVVLGHALSVAALRLAAVIGFLLGAALTVFAAVVKRLAPSDEAARIQAEYGHLIVPVVLGPDGLGGAPVDVPTIAALARLAESGQRLILHSRDNSRDTYLVNDEGTVYRYRADPGNVVWGEWSATAPRPLAHVAPPARRPAGTPRPVTATTMSAASPAQPPVERPSVPARRPRFFRLRCFLSRPATDRLPRPVPRNPCRRRLDEPRRQRRQLRRRSDGGGGGGGSDGRSRPGATGPGASVARPVTVPARAPAAAALGGVTGRAGPAGARPGSAFLGTSER